MSQLDIKLVTDRLLIRNFSPSDAQVLYEYWSHPMVRKFQNKELQEVQDAKDFITENQKVTLNQPNAWFQLAIEEHKSKKLVGDLAIHFLESGNPQCEVGFTISPSYQRNGYGCESVTRIVSYLFQELTKHRIIATVDPDNQPSRRLLEKLGFKQEAHFRKSLFFKGEWVDDVVYAMLREEWNATPR